MDTMKYESPFDSPSFPAPRETQHKETIAAFFFLSLLSLSEQEQGMQRNETKVNRLKYVKNYNKEEIRQERKCKVTEREREDDSRSFHFPPSPVASWLS